MNQFNFPIDPDDTRGRILQAAAELFAEKGYAGATTRAIAEQAGVNEVTIFRHFGAKENLVKAIMEQFGGMALAGEMELHFSGDLRQDLTMIGGMMLKVMTERSSAMRMALCEAGNFPEIRQAVADNPRQLRGMLTRYLEGQIAAGVIRPGHAEALAQAFLGMFFSYTVLRGFLGDDLDPQLSDEELVAQFVAVFVDGVSITEE